MDKQEAIDLIKDAGFGFLATIDGDQPRVRAVAPYINDQGELLIGLLATCRSLKQIQKNPKVEICFVDRRMSYCRISGKAAITDNKEKRQLMWDQMPMLRQYFSSPEDKNMKLVEMKIEQAEVMTASDSEPQHLTF